MAKYHPFIFRRERKALPPSAIDRDVSSMMDEYLFIRSEPDASDTGRTEMAYVPNETMNNIS